MGFQMNLLKKKIDIISKVWIQVFKEWDVPN